jgi:hypothetical protein
MTKSAQLIAFFANFGSSQARRGLFAVAILAAGAGAPVSSAVAGVRMANYAGVWNVLFATEAGNCSSTNSVPFTVTGRRVSSAGGGKVTGGISAGGSVAVQISVGASKASGIGRLAGNSGAGRWSGIISGDRCSGTWQAARS